MSRFRTTSASGADPLLGTARVILVIAQIVLIFGMVMLGIGIGAILTVGRVEMMAELAKAGAPDQVVWAVVAVMALTMGLLSLGVRFIRELDAIVKSVGIGDPFQPANADRLQRMGWITTAAFALSIVLGAVAGWIESVSDEVGDIDFDASFGGGGILLILTLFILARVFRHGAAMRDDLEGTV